MTTVKGDVMITIETFNKLVEEQIKSIAKFSARESGWKQDRWIIFSPIEGKSCLIGVDPLSIQNPLGRSGYIFVKDFYPKYTRCSDGETVYMGMYRIDTTCSGIITSSKECDDLSDLDPDEAYVVENGDLNIHRKLPVWNIVFVGSKEHEDISALVG